MEEKFYPKVTVGIIIYNDEGKIFLARCKKWGDKWVVPGGHIERGEGLIDGVKREVKEETNLDITNIEFIGIQESIFSKEFHKKKHFIFIDYVGKAVSNNIILNDELQEYIWINPKEALNKLDLLNATKIFIENFINKEVGTINI